MDAVVSLKSISLYTYKHLSKDLSLYPRKKSRLLPSHYLCAAKAFGKRIEACKGAWGGGEKRNVASLFSSCLPMSPYVSALLTYLFARFL